MESVCNLTIAPQQSGSLSLLFVVSLSSSIICFLMICFIASFSLFMLRNKKKDYPEYRHLVEVVEDCVVQLLLHHCCASCGCSLLTEETTFPIWFGEGPLHRKRHSYFVGPLWCCCFSVFVSARLC